MRDPTARSRRLTDGTRWRTFMRFLRLDDLTASYTNALFASSCKRWLRPQPRYFRKIIGHGGHSLMTKHVIGGVVFTAALGWAALAHAQIPIGTWERTDAQGKGIVMTVTSCCNGGL